MNISSNHQHCNNIRSCNTWITLILWLDIYFIQYRNAVQVEETRTSGVGKIEIEGAAICTNIINLICHIIQKRIIQQRYQDKFGEAHSHIIWKVFQAAIQKRCFTTTILNGSQYLSHPSLHCDAKKPFTPSAHVCNQAPEDIQHVPTCQQIGIMSKSCFTQEMQ
jgi:hypothetical protein